MTGWISDEPPRKRIKSAAPLKWSLQRPVDALNTYNAVSAALRERGTYFMHYEDEYCGYVFLFSYCGFIIQVFSEIGNCSSEEGLILWIRSLFPGSSMLRSYLYTVSYKFRRENTARMEFRRPTSPADIGRIVFRRPFDSLSIA